MATDTGRARADRLRSDRAIVLDLRRDGNRANYSAVDLCGLASRDEGPAAFADPAAAGRTLVRRAAQALCRALGVEPARPAARIVLYTTPWCGFCKRAAAYLRERGVAFEERDIEANRWAAVELERKMREAGLRGGGVPVIDIDGFLVVGFDRQRLDELLH
ncbi:MAG: hypothetical protein JXR96_28980 [Deltaproteobacteria bacterium]|nr:hypothetical protein [Deltaproteobacteria bacterium]